MSPARALGLLLLAVAAALGVQAASHVRVAQHGTDQGLLRLSWSARPERIEECRTATPAELAARPAHMRQATICEGTTARYRLEVHVNGVAAIDREVRGGGIRHDRRLYVFQELAVPAGTATVDVRFSRIDTPNTRPGPAIRTEFVAPRLELEARLAIQPRAVVLVTYDAERRALVAVSAASPAGR